MHVFHTPGVPPKRGKIILAIIGWTGKSRVALTKSVTANKTTIDVYLRLAASLGRARTPPVVDWTLYPRAPPVRARLRFAAKLGGRRYKSAGRRHDGSRLPGRPAGRCGSRPGRGSYPPTGGRPHSARRSVLDRRFGPCGATLPAPGRPAHAPRGAGR